MNKITGVILSILFLPVLCIIAYLAYAVSVILGVQDQWPVAFAFIAGVSFNGL